LAYVVADEYFVDRRTSSSPYSRRIFAAAADKMRRTSNRASNLRAVSFKHISTLYHFPVEHPVCNQSPQQENGYVPQVIYKVTSINLSKVTIYIQIIPVHVHK